MSKDVALFGGSNVPAYLKKSELDAATKALMGSSGYGKRLSIRGGRFRMLLNGEQAAVSKSDSLEVVVVAASPNVGRTYYEGEYDPDARDAPTCWSADGDRPDPSVKKPPAKSCATCPMNIKGSGKGDSKACRYSQRVAVVLADDLEGDIYQFNVSALSLFGKGTPGKWPLQAYCKMIAGKGVPITSLVTAMTFDEDASVPVVHFAPVRFLEEDEHATVVEQGQSEDAQRAVEQTMAETDGIVATSADTDEDDDEEAAPPPKKRTAATKKKAAPVVEEDEEDEEEQAPPPKKRPASKPAKKTAPSVFDEGEDEDDDEEQAPPPKKRPSKTKSAPAPAESDDDDDFAGILDDWDD